MTARDESRDALAKMLQELHGQYQEKLKRDDEFTIIEYAEANNLTIKEAGAVIDKLLPLGTVVFARKCFFRDRERNAYRLVAI